MNDQTLPPPLPENHLVREGAGAQFAGDEFGRLFNEWLVKHGAVGIYRTCGNCVHMTRDPDPAFCQLFHVTPPISVIVKGCDQHEDNVNIPF